MKLVSNRNRSIFVDRASVCDWEKQRSVSDCHDFLRSDVNHSSVGKMSSYNSVKRLDLKIDLFMGLSRINCKVFRENYAKNSLSQSLTSMDILIVFISLSPTEKWTTDLQDLHWQWKETSREVLQIEMKDDRWNGNESMMSRRISCPTLKWMDWMSLSVFNSSQV